MVRWNRRTTMVLLLLQVETMVLLFLQEVGMKSHRSGMKFFYFVAFRLNKHMDLHIQRVQVIAKCTSSTGTVCTFYLGPPTRLLDPARYFLHTVVLQYELLHKLPQHLVSEMSNRKERNYYGVGSKTRENVKNLSK